MSNSSEEVREFFNNEENMKALMNDKPFMEKVAGGSATAEDYGKKLSDLKVDMPKEDLEGVRVAVDRCLKATPEEVNDEIMDNISGGGDNWVSRQGSGLIAMGGAHLGFNAAAVGCGLASLAYSSKASQALKKGDTSTYAKYSGKSKKLGYVAGGCFIAGSSMLPLIAIKVGSDIKTVGDKVVQPVKDAFTK